MMKNQTEAEAKLIFVPYPTPGHILVTIEFAKSLIKRDNRIHTITILHWVLPHTPHAHLFAKSLIATEPQIRLIALPDVENPPPLELFNQAPEAYFLEFTKKTVPLVRDALSTIVSSRGSGSVRVVGLVIDFFSVPLIEVANEFNLPCYIFLTCNATFLGMMKYLPERHRRIASEFNKNSGDEEHSVPGYISSVPTKVFPQVQFVRKSYEARVEIAEKFSGVKGILVNSYTCLEQNAFDYFARTGSGNYPPVYSIGPVLSLNDRPSPDEDQSERNRIMRWLDDQPESSIVYLCFGSFGVLGAPQIEEIARALDLAGHRFLWSIRTDPNKKTRAYDLLPEGFLDKTAGKGLVCDWAPQVEVLAHKAIGGFVSHCGWNSLLESLWFGIPIATWPMYAEQQLNAFTMVKELGLSVELRLDYASASGEIVTAKEIVVAIRSLMESNETPRKKVKEMGEAARKALMDGGSSFVAVKRFLDELIGSNV